MQLKTTPSIDAGCIDGLITAEPTRGWVRRLVGRLLTLTLLIPVVGLLTIAGLAGAGYRPAVEQSDSMAPVIYGGDIVFSTSIPAGDAKVGDIVSFSNPRAGDGATLTHRVTSVHPAAKGQLAFVTRGDANTGSEHWKVPATGTVGLFSFAVPKVGYLVDAVQRQIFGFVIILAGAALSFDLLRRSWTSSRNKSSDKAKGTS